MLMLKEEEEEEKKAEIGDQHSIENSMDQGKQM